MTIRREFEIIKLMMEKFLSISQKLIYEPKDFTQMCVNFYYQRMMADDYPYVEKIRFLKAVRNKLKQSCRYVQLIIRSAEDKEIYNQYFDLTYVAPKKEKIKNDKRNYRLIDVNKYLKWRVAILKAYNHQCNKCGSKEKLECHHIKSWRNYESLRYEVSNGELLCRTCHKKTENYGMKAKKYQHL